MWIKGQQSRILVNLDNAMDVCVKEKEGNNSTVFIYSPNGYGIGLFKGTAEECHRVLEKVELSLIKGVNFFVIE